MHRLSLGFKILSRVSLAILSLLAVVGLFYQLFVVGEFDRRLSMRADGTYYKEQRFTGIAYSHYTNYRPQHVEFFWEGQHIWQELMWYPNGVVMAERPYRKGLPHGAWKMWYEDGSVKSLRHYRDGVIDGEMWGWHANGQVSDFNVYDHGKEITHKSWIADGTPFYNYVYQDGIKIGMLGGDFCKPLAKLGKLSSQ